MKKDSKGFSLIELMVTLVVIAILSSVVIPLYTDSVAKGRQSDAEGALLVFANAMERHSFTNSSYQGAAGSQITPLDTGSPWIFPSEAPLDSSDKIYDLTIQSATATTYTLRATPKADGPQASNGKLELDSTGARRWDRDNNGTFDADENCWERSC